MVNYQEILLLQRLSETATAEEAARKIIQS
jgi:hypothetical protein